MDRPAESMLGLVPLRHAWAMLRRPERSDAVLDAYLLAQLKVGGELHVALDDQGRRHLVIDAPVTPTGVPWESEGLSLRFQALRFADRERTVLDLVCLESDMHGVFDYLLESIVPTVIQAEAPASEAVRVLADWRQLLASVAVEPLSHEREMGLFAELTVMKRLALEGKCRAADWRGPLREPKDFVFPYGWVEVKAASPNSTAVRVHGVEQLGDLPGKTGGLLVLTLVVDEAGSTLNDLVAEIETHCEGRDLFHKLLLRYGWRPSQPPGRRWIIQDVIVTPAAVCPRVTANNVRIDAGVRQLTYLVAIDVLKANATPEPWMALSSLAGEAR